MAYCTNCGAPCRPGIKFCEHCGIKLETPAAQETTVPAEETASGASQEPFQEAPEQVYEDTFSEGEAAFHQEPENTPTQSEPAFVPESAVCKEKAKSPDHKLNKKLFLFGGIMALVLILILVLIIGKSEPYVDPGHQNESVSLTEDAAGEAMAPAAEEAAIVAMEEALLTEEILPEEDTAESAMLEPHPHAGYYSLVSYTANGITVDQEALSYLETEHYLKLNADGTGEIMVLGAGPIQLTWEEGTITTHDLLIMPYTVEEETLHLAFSTGIPMEFVRSQEPVAEVFEASEEAALGYSNWKGTMTIANTSGDIGYAEGDHAVWGIIGGTDSGDFFEIFDNPARSSENGENLLSMWIEIQENTVFPLIGSEDSWILDTYLDPEDGELLNIKKQNGMLDFTFPYTSYNGETAQLHFVLTPDK